jgi:predicted peroxiredoxin
MAKKLGILVSSNKHLDYVVNLTDAASNKGLDVEIFFTGQGVTLTQEQDFEKLVGKAKMSLCDVSFRALGLKGDVPGFGFKDFATQAKNAEIIKNSDRYIVL